MSANTLHTCALTSASNVDCWGYNYFGQLGDGTTTTSTTPVEVVGVGGTGTLSTVTAVTTGAYLTCALSAAGHVDCWGDNVTGQLGNGSTTASSTPVEVVGVVGSPPKTEATDAYNGDGLLVSQKVGTASQTFTWDLNTTSGAPQLLVVGTSDYVYGPNGLPLEQVTATTVRYYVHDQLGSTRLLTSSSGTVVATATYDPYGTLAASTGATTNPFGFAGAFTDPVTGLLYLVNRWYDPATGQFMSVDPADGLTGQPYQYVAGDPVNSTDPSGLISCPSWVPGCGVVTDIQHGVAGAASSLGYAVQHRIGHLIEGVDFAISALLAASMGIGLATIALGGTPVTFGGSLLLLVAAAGSFAGAFALGYASYNAFAEAFAPRATC